MRLSQTLLPARVQHLRKTLQDPEAVHPSRFRNKSEPSRPPETSRAPLVGTPKRLILRPVASKPKTQPSSREGTPTRSTRPIKVSKKPSTNLEKVVQTEQCLWSILEKIFRDEKTKRVVSASALLELIAVSIVSVSTATPGHFTGVQSQLRNLFFYVHQNYLHFAELVIARVSIDINQSIWAYTLKNVIQHKKVKRQARGDVTLWIHEHCEIIANLLRQITTTRSALPQNIQTVTARILASLQTISYTRSREMLDKAVSETRFLPPVANADQIYTLVLDLDETLVHYVDAPAGESKVLVRPGCEEFLRKMAEYYEVVIFTAAMQDYADWVINQLDQGNWVAGRLYRQHTIPSGSFFLKDLSKLGRDLARVIIIDNVAENFSLQPENGIVIRSWFDDEEDEALSQLEPLLIGKLYVEMPKRKVADMRTALRQFREQMLQKIAQGDPNPHLDLHILD